MNAVLSGNSVLEEIDVLKLFDLKTLDVQGCNLHSINLANNSVLTSLNCSGNAFTSIDLSKNTELVTLIGENLALTKINLEKNTRLANYSFTGNPDLTSIRVCPDFTMDNCLFTSAGNNPSLSIFNTAGNVFYYVGQYSTTFGSGGVVYEIINGGQNGKMVSVKEGSSLYWSTEYATTGAIDKKNGANNMATIKALNHDLSQYPAFKWCADYGTDWYLPALNELRVIIDQKSYIDSTLSANGYVTISAPQWSSTEYSRSYSYGYCYSGYSYSEGYEYNDDSKKTSKRVRAILAF